MIRRWRSLPRSAWLGLLAISFVAQAWAAEPRELNAAYIHFPPVAYTSVEGLPSGDIIQLAEQLAAELNLKLIWREYPINRIHHLLKTGEVDLWPSSKGVPALSSFTFESEPLLLRVKLSAYYRPDLFGEFHPDDLRSAQLILIRGYTYRDQLKAILADNPRSPIIAPNHSAALKLLNRGRGDLLISFAQPVFETLKGQPSPPLRAHVIDEWPLAFLVSRKTQGAVDLVEQLNDAYARYLTSRNQPEISGSAAPANPLHPGRHNTP